MALTQAEEARVAALEAAQVSFDQQISLVRDDVEKIAAVSFVSFVLNNWEVRPALVLGSDESGATLAIFTAGESDGAENAAGYVVRTGAKQNNSRHIPGTWHNAES